MKIDQMTLTQENEIITLALQLNLEELEKKLENLKNENVEVPILYKKSKDNNNFFTILDLVTQGLHNKGINLYHDQLDLHAQLCDKVYKFLGDKMSQGHFFHQFKDSWSSLLSIPYTYDYEGDWQGEGAYQETHYVKKETECNKLKIIRANYLIDQNLGNLLNNSLITKVPQRLVEEAIDLKKFVVNGLLKATDTLPPKEKLYLLQQSIKIDSNGSPANCLSKILRSHRGNCIQQLCSFFWHRNSNTASVNQIQKEILSIQKELKIEQERITEESNLLNFNNL